MMMMVRCQRMLLKLIQLIITKLNSNIRMYKIQTTKKSTNKATVSTSNNKSNSYSINTHYPPTPITNPQSKPIKRILLSTMIRLNILEYRIGHRFSRIISRRYHLRRSLTLPRLRGKVCSKRKYSAMRKSRFSSRIKRKYCKKKSAKPNSIEQTFN